MAGYVLLIGFVLLLAAWVVLKVFLKFSGRVADKQDTGRLDPTLLRGAAYGERRHGQRFTRKGFYRGL